MVTNLVDKTEGNIQFWTCSGGDYLEGWVSLTVSTEY